jgi:hypothetical protein
MGADPKPSARRTRAGKEERAAARAATTPRQEPLPPETVEVRPSATNEVRNALFLQNVLREFTERATNDGVKGVLKICPTERWQTCYLYWRWSQGEHAGHYVCVVTSIYDLSLGLAMLAEKYTAVLERRMRPTKDRY